MKASRIWILCMSPFLEATPTWSELLLVLEVLGWGSYGLRLTLKALRDMKDVQMGGRMHFRSCLP